jgi:hypothetical protein
MRPFKVEFSRNRTRNLGGPINALTTGKREWEGEVGMTGNGSGRFCPRMAEGGNGGVAHGTPGIHGIGDERREPRKRKGAEFFTTKDATGVGRGPETLPASCAKGREWRRGDSEEWPTEHTEYTERGTRGGNRGNGMRRSLFNHEIHERRDGRRAGTGDVARELRGGTRMAERGNVGVAHGIHGIHGKGGREVENRGNEKGDGVF